MKNKLLLFVLGLFFCLLPIENIYAEDEGFSAYLFTYFTGDSGKEESIRFALSNDGFKYKALNHNNPVIGSDTISDKGGVRDPHIMRSNDGNTFYMVATDMKSAQGWNSNHGIVMLKSQDLVHWTHSKVDIKIRFNEFTPKSSARRSVSLRWIKTNLLTCK
jgi:hypothetical protein